MSQDALFLQATRQALKTSQKGPETATDLQIFQNEKDEETRARKRGGGGRGSGGGGRGGGEASLKNSWFCSSARFH